MIQQLNDCTEHLLTKKEEENCSAIWYWLKENIYGVQKIQTYMVFRKYKHIWCSENTNIYDKATRISHRL